jgi:hypothetical protein
MKLNFWQIIGLIVLLIALIFIVKREMSPKPAQPVPDLPAAS